MYYCYAYIANFASILIIWKYGYIEPVGFTVYRVGKQLQRTSLSARTSCLIWKWHHAPWELLQLSQRPTFSRVLNTITERVMGSERRVRVRSAQVWRKSSAHIWRSWSFIVRSLAALGQQLNILVLIFNRPSHTEAENFRLSRPADRS